MDWELGEGKEEKQQEHLVTFLVLSWPFSAGPAPLAHSHLPVSASAAARPSSVAKKVAHSCCPDRPLPFSRLRGPRPLTHGLPGGVVHLQVEGLGVGPLYHGDIVAGPLVSLGQRVGSPVGPVHLPPIQRHCKWV